MPILMEALLPHSHIAPDGTQRVHLPGDPPYELDGGGTMTAEHVANAFEAAGWARRVLEPVGVGAGEAPRPKAKAKAR